MKQYVLLEFHNSEDIIVLVLYVEWPMTVPNRSISTALSTEYKKNSIVVMIKTEDIKQYVKNTHYDIT